MSCFGSAATSSLVCTASDLIEFRATRLVERREAGGLTGRTREQVKRAAAMSRGLPARFAELLWRDGNRRRTSAAGVASGVLPESPNNHRYTASKPKPPHVEQRPTWPAPGELAALRRRSEAAIELLKKGRHEPGLRQLRQAIGGPLSSWRLGSRPRRSFSLGVCAARARRDTRRAGRARRSQGRRRADAQRSRAHRRRGPQRPRVDRPGATGRSGKRHRDGARRCPSDRRWTRAAFPHRWRSAVACSGRDSMRRTVGAGAARRTQRRTTSHSRDDGGCRPSRGGDEGCLGRDVAGA